MTNTSGLRGETFLKRCGGRGLRVFAVRIPAASDLVGIYEDVGTVLMTWAHRASPRFNSQPLNPKGRRQALSEHPLGVFRSNGRSSRRSPPRRGTTVKPAKAYGKPAPPNMQRILARIKTVGIARVVRTTSFLFETSTRGQAS